MILKIFMPPKLSSLNRISRSRHKKSDTKNKKTFFKICLFLLLIICGAACNKTTNLNNQLPYNMAVEKSFVLQRDYYIFRARNITSPYIGEDFWLPKQIDSKYIDFENGEVKILGVAKKGAILRIKKFVEEYRTLAGTFDYLYVAIEGFPGLGNVNADSLTNSLHNPPTTKTWSDPPIFDPKAALPLPSDGIWWK